MGMVTLDIQNAFNAASWDKIMETMTHKNLPFYLCRLVNSYLSNRTLHYQQSSGEQCTTQVSCGVPQGSVLGPTLWNVMYDGFLRTRLPEGAKYLAFADDIAIIARGNDTIHIERVLTLAIEETMAWLQRTGLQLAVDKTKAMVVSNAHLHNDMSIIVQGATIRASRDLKYLGMQLDSRLSFTAHAKYTRYSSMELRFGPEK